MEEEYEEIELVTDAQKTIKEKDDQLPCKRVFKVKVKIKKVSKWKPKVYL